MNRFRVLHVIGGSKFGGIVPHVDALVRMAREHGGDATVLATDGSIVDYYENRGIPVAQVHGIERPINPLRDTVGLMRLVQYLRSNRYTIVHTHTSKGGFVGRLAARMANVPMTIHTTHAYAFTNYATNPFSSHLFLYAERIAADWCDFVITVNDDDHRKALDQHIVQAARVAAVKNGINLEELDAQLNGGIQDVVAEFHVRPNEPIVGFVGRLADQKGLEYFVGAMPMIVERFPACRFLIVGTGELEAELRRQVSMFGLSARVNFTGFRRDAHRLMQIMDVLVVSSLSEGMPITLLEGMAGRRPIVATRIQGVTDVCGDDADSVLLVDPANSAAIAAGVIRILGDRDFAKRLGSAARALVESKFSDRRMMDQTWSIYEGVARSKRIALNGQ